MPATRTRGSFWSARRPGVSLAPEGGAHQSVMTPLIGLGQPGLTAFEPAFVDELTEILRWSFEHIQADDGGAVYLRLSTRPLTQPRRELSPEVRTQIVDGGYWLVPPAPGAELAIVVSGPVISEALEAYRQIVEDIPGAGLLVVTSAGRLQQAWMQALKTGDADRTHVRRLLQPLAQTAGLVTLLDGHPATLSWLGSVARHRVLPLGVTRFGQSGDVPDLYHAYELDVDAILNAAARLCVARAYAQGDRRQETEAGEKPRPSPAAVSGLAPKGVGGNSPPKRAPKAHSLKPYGPHAS